MFVAARAFAPLIAIFGAGESTIGSLKVAVMSSDVPAFTGPVGEYVMAAVGAVLSNVKVIAAPLKELPALSVTVARTVYVPSVVPAFAAHEPRLELVQVTSVPPVVTEWVVGRFETPACQLEPFQYWPSGR